MKIEGHLASDVNISDIFPDDIIVVQARRDRLIARVRRVSSHDDIEIELYSAGRFSRECVTVDTSEIVENVSSMTRAAL